MSGAIAKRVNESKSRLAKASYFFATFSVFARWQTGEVRVSVDDEIRGGRMRDVLVANCRYFGGRHEDLPRRRARRRRTSTRSSSATSRSPTSLLTLPKIYRGTHLPPSEGGAPEAAWPSASTYACRCRIQLDGEQPGPRPSVSSS